MRILIAILLCAGGFPGHYSIKISDASDLNKSDFYEYYRLIREERK